MLNYKCYKFANKTSVLFSGIKTEAFKILIDEMDREGHYVLLRHGNIRKTYTDGADL